MNFKEDLNDMFKPKPMEILNEINRVKEQINQESGMKKVLLKGKLKHLEYQLIKSDKTVK